MIHKEVNKKSVIDLSYTDLAHEFSLVYVKELYDCHELLITCKSMVDTIIYVVELAHPKSKDTISLSKRLQFSNHLMMNCKERLLDKGLSGLELAILHTINSITRTMLAPERPLRVVK